jgi:hypothetical protein
LEGELKSRMEVRDLLPNDAFCFLPALLSDHLPEVAHLETKGIL